MSVTASVSLAALLSARRYVMYMRLLLVLLTFAGRHWGVLYSTSHPAITLSLPSYSTLRCKTDHQVMTSKNYHLCLHVSNFFSFKRAPQENDKIRNKEITGSKHEVRRYHQSQHISMQWCDHQSCYWENRGSNPFTAIRSTVNVVDIYDIPVPNYKNQHLRTGIAVWLNSLNRRNLFRCFNGSKCNASWPTNVQDWTLFPLPYFSELACVARG